MPPSCWSPRRQRLNSFARQRFLSTPNFRSQDEALKLGLEFMLVAAGDDVSLHDATKAQETATAPAPSRGQSGSSDQGPQKASGIVPPGVKLAASMPAAGAPRPFRISQSCFENSNERVASLRCFRSPRTCGRRPPRSPLGRKRQRLTYSSRCRADDCESADPGHRKALGA